MHRYHKGCKQSLQSVHCCDTFQMKHRNQIPFLPEATSQNPSLLVAAGANILALHVSIHIQCKPQDSEPSVKALQKILFRNRVLLRALKIATYGGNLFINSCLFYIYNLARIN